MKYLFLAFSLIASNAYAEQIISSNGLFNSSETGSAPICEKVAFLRQNVGDFVTGLTTPNLKLYMSQHIGDNLTANSGKPTNPILVSYSVNAVSGTPGLYNICVTPSDFAWQVSNVYEFRFLVSKSGNNGSFILKFQN